MRGICRDLARLAGAALGFAAAAGGSVRLEAQPPAPTIGAESFQPVEVVGLRNPERLSPDDLKRAYAAYRKWRPIFAPSARLYFTLGSRDGPKDVSGVRLRLVEERTDAVEDLALDAERGAALPELDYSSRRYALLANRKAGTLNLDVAAFSPGTDLAHRRMGDLRLQCRTWWAFIQPKVPVAAKALFGLAGGPCTSSKIGIYSRGARRIQDAQVVAGARRWPVRVLPNRLGYRVPLFDKSIPNDATLAIAYAP